MMYCPFFSGHQYGEDMMLLGVFLLVWALGLIIRNGPGYLSPLAPQ